MASQPWKSKKFGGPNNGRLKPAIIDPLEEIGLPSKGDERLLSHHVQEEYFTKIVDRVTKLNANKSRSVIGRGSETGNGNDTQGLVTAFTNLQIQQQQIGSKDISRDVIVLAMRKLREGIVASNRVDDFSAEAYRYVIRTAISWQIYEAYQPALLHLLYRMHPQRALSRSDVEEFASYRVLDLACRLAQYGAAHAVRLEWGLNSPIVGEVLTALVRNDSRAFWDCKERAQGHQERLIALADERVRASAVQSIARTYFTVDRQFVKDCTGADAEELVRDKVVDWGIEGDKVTVRRIKGR